MFLVEYIHDHSLVPDQNPNVNESEHILNREHYGALLSNKCSPSVFSFFKCGLPPAQSVQYICLYVLILHKADNDSFTVFLFPEPCHSRNSLLHIIIIASQQWAEPKMFHLPWHVLVAGALQGYLIWWRTSAKSMVIQKVINLQSSITLTASQ